jgi:hypothetical protein
MDENTPRPPDPVQDNGPQLSTGAKIGIGIGVVLAFIIVLVVLAFMLNNPATTESLRDIAIIVLALQTQVILIMLGILIYQLVVLIQMLRDDVKPMMESTQETLNTVKGTAVFVSERVTKPAISASSYFTGIGRSLGVLFSLRPRRRSSRSGPNETNPGG